MVLEGDGPLDALARFDGITAARITAGRARLELAEHAEPSVVLAQALRLARISRFEVQRPDLQEIFVKLVGG